MRLIPPWEDAIVRKPPCESDAAIFLSILLVEIFLPSQLKKSIVPFSDKTTKPPFIAKLSKIGELMTTSEIAPIVDITNIGRRGACLMLTIIRLKRFSSHCHF